MSDQPPIFSKAAFGNPFGGPFGSPFKEHGGFDPKDISDLVLWLDASVGITLNGSDVSGWADQSEHGNDAAQATPGKQPLFNSTGLNGFPSLEFDSLETDEMQIPNDVGTIGAISGSFTTYVVCNPQVSFGAGVTLWSKNNNANRFLFDSTGKAESIVAGTPGGTDTITSTNPVSLNSNVIMELHYEINATPDGAIDFTVSGADLGGGFSTNSLITVSTAALFIASDGPGLSQFFDGQIAQVLIYNKLLTTVERNHVGIYLAARYGLTWTTIA